jgi:hypothetical protein
MLGACVANLVDTCVASTPFVRTETFEGNGSAGRYLLVSTLTLFIMLAALLFVGKYLWNNILVDLVSFARPVKSVWQLLGLAILISLIHPGCNCRL